MKQLLLSVAIALTGVAASALEYSTAIGHETGRKYIIATGPVQAGDALRLSIFAAQHPDHNWISLSSPGGVANEGYRLGATISDLELNTYVGYGQMCLSACYTAFLGGSEYDIDGLIGAHNAYVEDTSKVDPSVLIIMGQQYGAYDALYHLQNGFNFSLPYLITRATNKEQFLFFTDEKELDQFFARTDENNLDDYISQVPITHEWINSHVGDGTVMVVAARKRMFNKWPDLADPRQEWKILGKRKL